ncbi:MAG: hypothetical protein ACR2JE_14065 [Acidobacteriaceae bacterium]
MRTIVRLLLAFVFFADLSVAAFLLYGPKEKETWATLTAVLAVLAAVISAWPSLRVLEMQEDASRPRPTPYFDITSRYGLLQLRVKNLGAGVAYDVRLTWKTHPCNEEGEELSSLDVISVLIPQDSASVMVGRPQQLFRKYPTMNFEGTVEFRDASRRRISYSFICSADEHRKRLVHDEEWPKTLRELQDIPKELGQIAAAIRAGTPSQE